MAGQMAMMNPQIAKEVITDKAIYAKAGQKTMMT